MKLSFRKSWWWVMPLAVILLIAALVAPLFVRHARQRRIAQEIVDLGGAVFVQNDAPEWLQRLASDDTRGRLEFGRRGPITPAAPAWLRNHVGAIGLDSLIQAWDVADLIAICVGGPAKADEIGSNPDNLPEIMSVISTLSTVSELDIVCRTDCKLDFSVLLTPQSLRTLEIDNRGPDDLEIFEKRPRGRFIAGQMKWPPVRVEIIGLGTLKNLQTLRLSGFDDHVLDSILECESLRSLSVEGTFVTDAGVARIVRLSNLESLELGLSLQSDATLGSLKALKKLNSLQIRTRNASPRTMTDVLSWIPGAQIENHPYENYPYEDLDGDPNGLVPGVAVKANGFDRWP